MAKNVWLGKPPRPAVRRRRIGPAVWDPSRVGESGYAKSQETFDAKVANGKRVVAKLNARPDRPTRAGIPDGWGGDRNLIDEVQIEAAVKSKEIVKMAIENGTLQKQDDPRVERAFEVAEECLNALHPDSGVPLHPIRDRLAAGRFLADFLKSRPASKIEATVNKPEDFLAFLATAGKATE